MGLYKFTVQLSFELSLIGIVDLLNVNFQLFGLRLIEHFLLVVHELFLENSKGYCTVSVQLGPECSFQDDSSVYMLI